MNSAIDSLKTTSHLSPHENILIIALIYIQYLYNISFSSLFIPCFPEQIHSILYNLSCSLLKNNACFSPTPHVNSRQRPLLQTWNLILSLIVKCRVELLLHFYFSPHFTILPFLLETSQNYAYTITIL